MPESLRARALMLPEPGEVLVLYTDPDAIAVDHARELYLPRLSEAERTQHGRFRFDEDRHTYLVAHALVRTALGSMLSVAESELQFAIGEHGKPELVTRAQIGLRFNLSHTRGLVACAFGLRDDLGVDVEHVDRKTEIETLAKSVLSPLEQAAVEALEGVPRRERFFRHWTLKEAYVKAMGRGIALPLRSLHVELSDPSAPKLVFNPPFEDDASSWWLASEAPLERHVLGVAMRTPIAPRLRVERVVP